MSKLYIKSRFATIPHELLYNASMSLKSKGLFAYIQGKPDGWSFSAERISKECSEGLQAVRGGLQELEQNGYLERKKNQTNKGTWEHNYVLHDTPIPNIKNRPMGTHTTDEPSTDNPYNNSNTDNKNKSVLNPPPEYVGLKFVSIKDFKQFVSDFSLNKEYLIVAIKFWKLWMLENPNHTTTMKAEVLKWYDVIRKIIEIDKQKIQRLLAIYEYFYRCHLGETGYRNFWFRTVKSVGGLRHTNENGEYRLDKIIDEVNEKIAKDSDFGRLVENKIKQFKEHESIKLS